MQRLVLGVVVLALTAAGCGGMGVGLPACDTPTENPDSASVLTLQAVPGAEYSPCLYSLQLGWDVVEFEVERGLAKLEFGRQRELEFQPFLEVRLTPTCDIGDAVEVPSGMDGIVRYDDVTHVTADIHVTIIPDGERPRIHAQTLADELKGTRVEDREVIFEVDGDIDFSVRSRVNKALFADEYVWIINDLDIDEGTLEVRRTPDGEGARGLTIREALHRVEEMTADASYKGYWYFVFAGGCITYDFDAKGTLAATIADDVQETVGFYPNAELREAGRRAGYDVLDE